MIRHIFPKGRFALLMKVKITVAVGIVRAREMKNWRWDESIRPFRFTVNSSSWEVCLPHKIFTFNSAVKRDTRGVIVSWLTSKGMFSLFVAFEGVDSEKFNDFLRACAWRLLSCEDTDDGRRRLILTCVSCVFEQIGTSIFLSRPERMTALNILLPQRHKTRLDKTLDSTMCGPISDQSSANYVPPRFLRPERLL